MADDVILATEGLTKEFKGFVAVDDVDLTVRARHDPRADRPERRRQDDLLQPADQVPRRRRAGTIVYNGRDITATKPADDRAPRARALVPDLGRVPAPDACSRTCASRCSGGAATSFDFWRSEKVLRALDARGRSSCSRRSASPTSPTLAAVELPYGRKRALEIATTLALEPELMLLDEPTPGMGHEDVDRIARADQAGLGEAAPC